MDKKKVSVDWLGSLYELKFITESNLVSVFKLRHWLLFTFIILKLRMSKQYYQFYQTIFIVWIVN